MTAGALEMAARLAAAGEPFVLATVVWRQGPSSGKAGAKAVIGVDGKVHGWLGGACAEPTVAAEARRALADGTPRLLALGERGERAAQDRPGLVVVPMACESEGAMDVFLEPVIPEPHVVVVGRSPAVAALARMATALGWEATVVDAEGDPADYRGATRVVTELDLAGLATGARTMIVVATQGHYDEQALEAALATEAGYVGLVASRKRADSVTEFLRSRGVTEETLARVRAPAGLDLGAVAHTEIAVAVLAELVALRAAGGIEPGAAAPTPPEAIDPVCGMTVALAAAHHSTEHGGQTYHFCAAGCLRRFTDNPSAYIEEPA